MLTWRPTFRELLVDIVRRRPSLLEHQCRQALQAGQLQRSKSTKRCTGQHMLSGSRHCSLAAECHAEVFEEAWCLTHIGGWSAAHVMQQQKTLAHRLHCLHHLVSCLPSQTCRVEPCTFAKLTRHSRLRDYRSSQTPTLRSSNRLMLQLEALWADSAGKIKQPHVGLVVLAKKGCLLLGALGRRDALGLGPEPAEGGLSAGFLSPGQRQSCLCFPWLCSKHR